jgi:hypothetical protein
MTRTVAAVAVALALGACRHASKVGAPAGDAGSASSERSGEPSRADKGVPPKGEVPRVPSSPKALLAKGEIARIQTALEDHGYLSAHRTGELDDATTTALRKFQRDQLLAETGFPDRLTLQMLGVDPEEAYGKVKEPKDEQERKQTGEGSAGEGNGK